MIIGELIETLIKQIDFPLALVELEGDALFMYCPKTAQPGEWQARSEHVVERILRMFWAPES